MTKSNLTDEDLRELQALVGSFPSVYCNVCGVKIEGMKMAPGPEYCNDCLSRRYEESRPNTQSPVYDIDEILVSSDFLGSIHSALPHPLDGLDDQLFEAELIVRGVAEFEGVIGNGISAFVFNQNFDLLEQSLWSLRQIGKSHALNAMEELESLIRENGFPESAKSRREFYDSLQESELEIFDDKVRSINERYFADGSDQNLWHDRTVINMARKCLEDSIDLLRNRKAQQAASSNH